MAMKDGNGKFNTALLDYVRRGSVEVLQSLLRNDYPDSIDLDGKTLLHHDAEWNNVSMTKHFINNNHNLDIVDNRGQSPLMLAVENRSYNSAKLLVEAGADIYLRSDEAANILSYVEAKFDSNSKYLEFVKDIFQKLTKDCLNDEKTMLSRLREFGYSLFHVISLGDANVTRLMLENGYSVDERDFRTNGTALHRAVYLGDLENVKVLLEFDASVQARDEYDYLPLFHLFDKTSDCGGDEQERVEIMKILIEHGALHSKAPNDPIEYIFDCGGLRAITALVQYDVDFNYAAALSSLVNHENNDVLEVIRGKNIDVNVLHDGFSLLSMAVCRDSLRKVQFLLECSADPNIVNDGNGQTPLSSVFYYLGTEEDLRENFLEILRLLLQYGADAQQVITNKYQEQQTVFDIDNDSSLRQQALEPVVAHLAMIESCGETISDLIRQKIDSEDIYKQHFQKCKKQIDRMKETTVNGSCTLYKLLTESHLKITKYARDPEFTAKFEEAMRRFLVPYYSTLLHERVGKATHEARLREEAVVVMGKIFSCRFRHCTDIFGEILDNLTCDDLKNICDLNVSNLSN